ncbi:MAG: triose-phosphate isomerase [Bacilli bacterium]|nr:triose-phosphate isomerase [Bacilli bacterium]
MRKKLLMGNWKMNKTIAEAVKFVEECDSIVDTAEKNNIDLGVAPTFLSLKDVKAKAPKGLIISAQNVNDQTSGAFTGEVSPEMLQEIKVTWAIIGHSERRTYNGETSQACNKKMIKLLNQNMVPLYCCGETLETYEKGETKNFIKDQIVAGFKDIPCDKAKNVVIAYEPIWSIGTGKNASKEIAQDICAFIRATIKELYGEGTANDIRILYGGSVKPNNIKEYLTSPDIDGALVGGASLAVDSFHDLLMNIIQ